VDAAPLRAGRRRTRPLVSVVLTVFDGERYLAESIRSVLCQTYTNFELIVVDDGSSDGSADVAASFGGALRLIRQANAGHGAALNRGIAVARGAVLAFQDADDLWIETKLARQIAALQAEPRLDLVFGHVQQFYSPDLDADLRRGTLCRDEALPGVCTIAAAVRRPSFDRVGPFETHWRVGAFMSWYLRAREAGLRARVLDDVVAHRRLHAANHGRTMRGALIDRVRILKASLDRRRAAGAD
jgi:glycosyltransferase involved in cell wall biosynthesis